MNTEEWKITTPMIVEALRADGEPKLLLLAADRLEELQQERYEARAEVEWLKREPRTVIQQVTARPEPSRLEIAAMILQGMLALRNDWLFPEKTALERADALIAAAREGGK